MKIELLTIGKSHATFITEGIETFTQRISRYFPAKWRIISTPKNSANLSESELKLRESLLILETLKADDYLIALDEMGKMISSEKLADFIQIRANESTKQLVFLIGGVYGLHESVIDRANFTWSLSSLTFPHQLVRLMLAEQIYRACTIIQNEKYHHE